MPSAPPVSVVVVAYGMARELPRTLRSLDPRRQRGVDAADYEVVLVDNGSPVPVDLAAVAPGFAGELRLLRVDDASPSPAAAANLGIAEARGELVGVVVDGARICSPGLVAGARRASGLAARAVVTAPAYHLGPVPHMRAAEEGGWDQAREDDLLASVPWEDDAAVLHAHCSFAGSSSRGWFGPMGESSSLFLARALWEELGGYDEAFDLPGGGLMNHDVYRRACALPGVELVVLLGEGTFHQFHGGAATSRRIGWDDMHAQYVALRGERYVPPQNEPLYLGTVPRSALELAERSARLAIERRDR